MCFFLSFYLNKHVFPLFFLLVLFLFHFVFFSFIPVGVRESQSIWIRDLVKCQGTDSTNKLRMILRANLVVNLNKKRETSCSPSRTILEILIDSFESKDILKESILFPDIFFEIYIFFHSFNLIL